MGGGQGPDERERDGTGLAARRGQVLADLAELLDRVDDVDGLLAGVTDLAVRYLAPLAAVALLDDEQQLYIARVGHRDPEAERRLVVAKERLGPLSLTGRIGEIIRGGRGVHDSHAPLHPALSEALADFVAHHPVADRFIAPLHTDEGPLGALVLMRHVGEEGFGVADANLATVLADRVALAVAHVRLDARRRAAEAATTLHIAQQEAVARLAREALSGTGVTELAGLAAKLVSVALTVPHAWVLLDDEHPDGLLLVAATGPLAAEVGERRSARAEPLVSLMSRGSTTLVDELDPAQARARSLIDQGFRSLAVSPIRCRSTPPGVLAVGSEDTASFAETDTLFLDTIADVLASAVDSRRVLDDLRHNALHDDLTGLPNRSLVVERLETALDAAASGGGQVAVLVCDLDRFKLVNDGLGHAAGDEVLLQVAERLQAAVRPLDTVGRFGGDEFVVVCPDVGSMEAVTGIADRLSAAFTRPIPVLGHTLVTTASIGIAVGSEAGADAAQSLLRDADAAMYRAKDRGRARCELFDDAMREQASERLLMETELRRALGSGELVLHYQPVLSAHEDRVVGVEALVRWEHPVRGRLEPADFVPLASETSLILELGAWVFDEAARQLARWARMPGWEDRWLSVNLAPRQVADPALLLRIDRALADAGADPTRFRVELTEAAIVADGEQIAVVMEELRERGIGISVDDFGTGYSSLPYLKRLPVTSLKLDQSFVEGLAAVAADGSVTDDRVITAAVVVMAKALGLAVVAEGVETSAQLDAVRDLGCDLVQGFLHSRALPAPELEAWLAAQP